MSNFQSIVFNANGSIADTSLEEHIRPNALGDTAKAQVGIRTHNTSDTFRFQQNAGDATATPRITQVQLQAPTGRIAILGTTVAPDVYEKMKETSPELFLEPAAKAAEVALEADNAKDEEATREELNRHPGEIEGYHQHITGEVNPQHLISLMVYGQRGEAPPADLISNIARDMGEPVDAAVQKINLVNQGVQAQFTVLAKSMGLNADAAADWLREHRKDTSMAAVQAHYLRRDLMAWKPLLSDYQAATGDGRKH
jgi:hypothetical protein